MFRKLMMAIAATMLFASVAFAEEAAAAASGDKFASLGAGLCMGIAVLGGTLAQSKAAASALEGIARNPSAQGKIFVPMIIGLALIESLVLLAFVIAFIKIKI